VSFFTIDSLTLDPPIQVTGTLKGYDQLMNLVLDNVKEITRGNPHVSS